MLRRISLLAAIVVLTTMFSTGMTMAATKTATSAVTVVVPGSMSINPTPLPAMVITVATLGVEASGTANFTVKTNIATTLTVGVVQPTTPSPLVGLSGFVLPVSTPASDTAVVLTGKITVPVGTAKGSYTGGSITVTVTYTP